MAEIQYEIQGLAELKAALKEMEGKVPKELAKGFKAIAATIADKVRSQMPPKFQKTVKASGTQTGGAVKYAAMQTSAPWNTAKNITGWWDFGGHVGRGRGWNRPWGVRTNGADGRFLYPTIKGEKSNTIKMIDDLIRTLAARAGFEQEGEI